MGWGSFILLFLGGFPGELHAEAISIPFEMGQTQKFGVSEMYYEYRSDNRVLRVRVEDNRTLHFEYLLARQAQSLGQQIATSAMVEKKEFPGPTQVLANGNQIQTEQLTLTVTLPSLCFKVHDRILGSDLASICAENIDQDNQTLVMLPDDLQNVYGLGNYFYDGRNADGDWSGRDWNAEGLGNVRHNFMGGAPSISQFPILYALGPGLKNMALFLDHTRKLSWNFRDPRRWTLSSPGESLRFYVMLGPNLKSLRKQFMELVGKPLIPPQSTFGLWVSKFGYESWSEIRDVLSGLKQNHFPVDGVALDLQWFGGRFKESDVGRMGSLSFDESSFPTPEKEIPKFRKEEGIRFMAIEESYVDDRLPEYQRLKERQHLARTSLSENKPVQFGSPGEPYWWGRGGMIDWTHPGARKDWHQEKRLALGKMGIQHHWTDLGEPEMYDGMAFYHGVESGKIRHWDIHNLYNLMWLQGIHEGYEDSENQNQIQSELGLNAPPRYFSMSRSGAPGLQRMGAGMWSGDIGRNTGSLIAHLNTQMHMSLAGVDYYNSDVGGFTIAADSYLDPYSDSELYTQWFASSALGEIPLRPHGWSYGNKTLSFSPNQRGNMASNRANLIRRYEMFPYIYSLAHRAFHEGEPIFPPMVYEFQNDSRVRQIGNQKMIGDFLLYGVVVGIGQTSRSMYLPQGRWVNYNTLEWFDSKGEETPQIPLQLEKNGQRQFTLPLFARAGSIIPKREFKPGEEIKALSQQPMYQNVVMQVVSGAEPSSFTFYEDDGETLAYRNQAFHSTVINQVFENNSEKKKQRVEISPTVGHYEGASEFQTYRVDLIVNHLAAQSVVLNGEELAPCKNQSEWDQNTQGCFWNDQSNPNLIRIKSKLLSIRVAKNFEINF